MEAKELRIGNYVNFKFHKDCGGVKGIEVFVSDLEIILQNNSKSEYYTPTPLTEELLVKFGFELKKVSMGGREYEGWRNFSFHLDTNYIKNTLFYHWMGGNIEIKHVHQLQNLYFALTGEELIIK